MPRGARQKSSNKVLYHVTERGNERRALFHDDEDRLRFLDIVKRNQEKYGFKVYAYCLMTTHLHLLLACHDVDISQVMKSINVSYVIFFNRKYERCGHLFQDRFKSELVDTNEYVIEVSRYIHLNPVRAGIVSSDKMVEYRWSSYRHYLHAEAGGQLPIDTTFLLGLFSDSPELGRAKYQEYVMREETAEEYNAAEGGASRIGTVFQQTAEPRKPISTLKAEELSQLIAAACGEEMEDIREKRSSQVGTRNQAIREIRKRTQMTLKEIGLLFGGLSESMISRILKTD